ncbi:MAG: MDR family MFS transporter [bacterium]
MPRKTNRPLTVVSLLLAMFLSAMEMTVVSTAMPTAVGDLGGIHLYAWVFAAYMLTATVTLPIYGKLADLYGRKPVMLAGLALFLGGSFLCGRASGMSTLILFRAIQGLGAGAIQPISMTIVGDLYDVHHRARIQGILGAVWGLAGLVGPVLGGAIVHWLSWRWVFYVNIPMALACAAVFFLAYHEDVERHDHRLDFAGAVLLSLTVVFALLTTRSRAEGLGYLPAAGVTLALFLWAERRAEEPLLPLDLFSRRVMAVASATGALVGAAMISVVTFVPLYVQSVLGGSPTDAGTAIAPIAIGWPVSSTLAGRILPRTGYRALIRGGLAMTSCAALGLSFLLRPGADLWSLRLAMLFYGLGLGLANTPLIIAVQSSVPWNLRGVATASTMFSRSIGGTLAVGVLGGVLAAALAAGGAPPGAVDKLLGPERAFLPAALVRSLSGALQGGMEGIFQAVAVIAFAGFAVSLLFPAIRIAPRGPATDDAPPP